MKAMVGLGIFRKPEMLPWILSGIREHFPEGTPTVVYMEAADADMHKAWDDNVTVGEFRDMPLEMGYGSEHILEVGVHCWLLDRFMASDCDVLVIPQDDNRFERPIMPDLERLWEQYGTRLGWISARDGYGFGYSDMVCSPFSDSNAAKRSLPVGTHAEVRMMNTGPVVYFRHVVEKVGKPDISLPWFFWDDLCLRCDSQGMVNALLSMDALHQKFGRVGSNPGLFDDKLVADCLRRFNERWKPVYGRNPL